MDNVIKAIIELLSLDIHSVRFKKYLKKQSSIKKQNNSGKILVEFEQSPENILALSIFLPVFQRYFKGNFVSYKLVHERITSVLTNRIRYKFSTTRKILGREIIIIRILQNSQNVHYVHLWEGIKTKTELVRYTYKGIHIGDLVYDEYLAVTKSPTVNLSDPYLEQIFCKALSYLDHWMDFAQENEVNALIASHNAYLFGIPVRVFIQKEIPVFLVSSTSVVRLSKDNPNLLAVTKKYHSNFLKLDSETAEQGLDRAREKLQNRLQNIGPSDLYYLPYSAFGSFQKAKRVLIGKKERRILIAAHDFYDSPHGNGLHFYPDFYEWILRLIEISSETNYDWYIKTHPFLRGRGREILENLVSNVPNFYLLDEEITHNQIIYEGIDLALTVIGTIATEYPLFGIPVMNASQSNPHSAYTFSFTPKDVLEYESLLRNLDDIPKNINADEIYEYYYMHNLRPLPNWIFANNNQFLADTGFGVNIMTRKIYSYFLDTDNKIDNVLTTHALNKFFALESSILDHEHYI